MIHDDFASYIRTALLWVASPNFINERPDDVAAFERGFILENPHPQQSKDYLDTYSQIKLITLLTVFTRSRCQH